MPAIARVNGPIDVFENLYRINHKLGMEAGGAHVSFMVFNVDILHVNEHFGISLETWIVYGGSRMRAFWARIIQLLHYCRFVSRFYTSVLY